MKSLYASLLCLLCLPAFADGLSYTYLQADYSNVDLDNTRVDVDVFGIGGSALIAPAVFFVADFSHGESDNFGGGSFDTTLVSAGFGLRHPLARAVDLTGTARLVHADIDGKGSQSGADDDDTGYGLAAGLRGLITPEFELNGTVAFVDIFDDTTTTVGLAALFHLGRQFSIVTGFSTSSDAQTFTVGGRLNL